MNSVDIWASPVNGTGPEVGARETAWAHNRTDPRAPPLHQLTRLQRRREEEGPEGAEGSRSRSGSHGRDGEAQDLRGEGARRRRVLPHRRIRSLSSSSCSSNLGFMGDCRKSSSTSSKRSGCRCYWQETVMNLHVFSWQCCPTFSAPCCGNQIPNVHPELRPWNSR
ncbi:hypothetical protein BAE44_0011157 [Dichanthelium oligosanthes]|uniref:Uncharacterized protein n=1 Tax=Dichanthelium oligosanthes TaxID=888268 RepID=A0A1E5VRX2_9POAL|nr:hypothetical protein BAE44_0011157 [Dichanthelium oligosanthes]